jgi:hypothetical protein
MIGTLVVTSQVTVVADLICLLSCSSVEKLVWSCRILCWHRWRKWGSSRLIPQQKWELLHWPRDLLDPLIRHALDAQSEIIMISWYVLYKRSLWAAIIEPQPMPQRKPEQRKSWVHDAFENWNSTVWPSYSIGRTGCDKRSLPNFSTTTICCSQFLASNYLYSFLKWLLWTLNLCPTTLNLWGDENKQILQLDSESLWFQ